LPWIGVDGKIDPEYEFPLYLEGIVDQKTGHLDANKLNQKLREIEALRARQHMLR